MEEYLTYQDVNIRPQYSEISSRSNVDISTEICGHELEVPVIASPMKSVIGLDMQFALSDNGATGAFCRFNNQLHNVEKSQLSNLNPVIGSQGVDDYNCERFYDFIDILLIDVAHGHHKKMKETIKTCNKHWDVPIIAGNIATPPAAQDLESWGADCLRVGIGAGASCSTREKTAVGVPMISCLQEICEITNLPVIADGGMRSVGDICKALSTGADAVMLGSMLSGTKEAPGEIIELDDKKYKKFYGSASERQKGNNNYVEGISTLVEYKGSVTKILKEIEDGIRSSFSYVGAKNLEEFHEQSELIKVTDAAHMKGKPHIKYE